MRGWRLVVLSGVLALLASPSDARAAKTYRAARYDVKLELAADGSMVVTERVSFEFGPDSFTEVFRELPTRRTDGIAVLAAGMDGVAFGRGDKPGQFDTRRGDRGKGLPRVTWHFAAVTASTHTFELAYRVAGVIVRSPESDLLEWRILPTRHEYPIDCSALEVVAPAGVAPIGHARLTPPAGDRPAASGMRFERCQFSRDESWVVALDFPARSLAPVPPEWQQTAERGRRWAPVFGTIAAVLALTGAMALLFFWNNQRPAVARPDRAARQSFPPADLPPAMAGVLARPGASPGWENAVATVLDLARRGTVRIEETEKRFGQRQFQVVRVADPKGLSTHEQVVVDMLFTTRKGPVASVKFSDLRRAAPRHWRRFKRQLREDLRSRGLISEERERTTRLTLRVGAGLIAVSVVGFVGAVFSVNRFEAWPLLVPGSILLVALATLALSIGLTPLSDEGLRQAAAWRAFGGHLRDVGRGRGASLDPQRFGDFLPYAASFGAALGWAKLLKKSGATVTPAWILPAALASGDEMGAVIAALTAATAAGGHVDGGASSVGAAGAAGGGASGAH
jgi:hypothetical protein